MRKKEFDQKLPIKVQYLDHIFLYHKLPYFLLPSFSIGDLIFSSLLFRPFLLIIKLYLILFKRFHNSKYQNLII
jgi:hypothetical protein